jgi:hypothetical protein
MKLHDFFYAIEVEIEGEVAVEDSKHEVVIVTPDGQRLIPERFAADPEVLIINARAEEPPGKVTQVFRSGHDYLPVVIQHTVADIMHFNAGFEDSGWLYISEAVTEGMYDDSDPSSGVVSWYMVARADREAVVEEMSNWRSEFLRDHSPGPYSMDDFPLPRVV